MPVRITLILACVLAALGCGPVAAGAQAGLVPIVESSAPLRDRRLTESSGVAASRTHPGLFWTHDDSGDQPILYATNARGDALGRYVIAGAAAVDWEDIALGACPSSKGDCLYIADTGDNAERRRSVFIYIVPEPPPPDPSRDRPDQLTARRLRLRYTDGPHDVEALAVTPTGDVLLVSKGRATRPRTYRIPAATIATRSDAVVSPAPDDLGIPGASGVAQQVTGAAVDPDGTTLVVRTYTTLRLYALGDPIRLIGVCWLGLRQPQGEAVDFLGGDRFVLTSEAALGQPATVMVVRCPFGKGDPRK